MIYLIWVIASLLTANAIVIYATVRSEVKKKKEIKTVQAEDERLRRLVRGNMTELDYAGRLINNCFQIESE